MARDMGLEHEDALDQFDDVMMDEVMTDRILPSSASPRTRPGARGSAPVLPALDHNPDLIEREMG